MSNVIEKVEYLEERYAIEEPEVLAAFRHLLLQRRIRTFVDVGAAIGTYSMFAMNCCPTLDAVVAVEPDNFRASILEEKFSVMRKEKPYIKTMDVIIAAVSNYRELVEFETSVDQKASGALVHPDVVKGEFRKVVVSATTLGQILSFYKVDPATTLIKLDIEGSEHSAMRGIFDSSFDLFGCLLIEVHSWGDLKLQTTKNHFMAYMQYRGFKSAKIECHEAYGHEHYIFARNLV